MILLIFIIGFILGLLYSFVGEKLPLRLPEIEEKEANSWILNLFVGVLNGLILLVSFYSDGFGYDFLMNIIIYLLLFNIFVSDFKYMIILDSPLIFSAIYVLIIKYCYLGIKSVGISLLSGLILFILMLIISFIGRRIFKKEALGGGDIKLAFVIGLILDIRLGLCAIILSSLLALPYALGSLMLKKDSEVPFGPFLVGSLCLVFIFSDKFLNLINYLT